MVATSPALPWERFSETAEDTESCGRQLAEFLEAGTMIRLEGDLGAGKTTFTRGLAAGLGVPAAAVHSPSYSLVHLYHDSEGRAALYHVDLYRVGGTVDLEEIGLEDLFASDVPMAVEWPERLGGLRRLSGAGDLCVRLEMAGRQRRHLTVRRLDQDSSW